MPEQLAGLIVQDQSGFYWVETTDGRRVRCELRGRLKEEAKSSDIAAIGDRVQISLRDEDGTEMLTGVIEEIEDRNSVLSRAVRTTGKRGAGQAEREHVIIANAEQALFVFAVADPPPNFRMLDRLLVAGEKSEIERLIIVVNKTDLEDPSNVNALFAPYHEMDYEILHTSATEGVGIEALKAILKDKISVFTGPSGVAKPASLTRFKRV